jgi:hypothetical protein
MLKELIKETDQRLTERAVKWRNLIYDKAGKAYLGNFLHNSVGEADAQLRDVMSRNEAATTMHGILYFKDYAWHMQIPVMEGA